MHLKKLILMLSFPFFLLGCSVICPNVPFPVLSTKYHDLLGQKIKTLTPMTLEKSINNIGDNYYFINYQHVDYGRKIVDIPVGTVLIVDHMNRKYHIEYGTTDELIVRLNVPGYTGKAILEYKTITGKRIWFYNEESFQFLDE
jgi:hypothetical protein